MKRVFLFVGVILINISFGANEAEEFFYKRGFEAGYNQGFEAGVKKAMEEAKLTLVKYRDTIKSYEISKYLIRSKRLTYPQIWQEKDSKGGIKITVLRSEIEDELDIDAIFDKFGSIPSKEFNDAAEIDNLARNSVYLSYRDNAANSIPSASDREKNINTISLKKTWKNEDILKKANLVYADDGDNYKVMFFSEQEKKDFCKSFGVCK
jgi:hypothetical protein